MRHNESNALALESAISFGVGRERQAFGKLLAPVQLSYQSLHQGMTSVMPHVLTHTGRDFSSCELSPCKIREAIRIAFWDVH